MKRMKKKVAFFTLGCKLNFAETSALAGRFIERGYERTTQMDNSDIIVINTCSVTSLAEKKGRNLLSKARKKSPDAKIIVMGCYAQLHPEDLQPLQKADLILGNQEKLQIFDYLEYPIESEVVRQPFRKITEAEVVYSSQDRTRTFLKIQDGCSYFCAYCTIPMARGLSRSPGIDNVLKAVKQIVDQGSKEIILTGVNIGDFGRQHHQTFAELLRAIIKIKGLRRLRLGSVEPNLLTNEIIELVANHDVLMPHFHMPLQCGTDDLLRKMKRRYTTAIYANRVDEIQKQLPDACIVADVIVGVPGETAKLHDQAKAFIKQLGISALHVFTYSERPQTAAAEMPEQVHNKLRQERSQEMHALSDELHNLYIQSQINKKRPVLFEKNTKNDFIYGFTDNYIRVKYPFDNQLIEQIKTVKLIGRDREGNVNAE